MEEDQSSHVIKIEQFAGPFHILVGMLEKEKLPITEVSLSKVTEQYLEAINSSGDGQSDPYILADFLVVAAKLVYLKSKALLPVFEEEEDENGTISLEDQLRMYKAYYDASKVIDKMLRATNISFTREKLAIDIDVIFNPPHNLTMSKMRDIFAKVVEVLEPIVKIPKKVVQRVMSLRDKINNIRNHILEKVNSSFFELTGGGKNKVDSILTFLALLELVKQRVIHVDQEGLHGDIKIAKQHNYNDN